MNESALEALTAPMKNQRQAVVVALARLCLAQYPHIHHADKYRVMVQSILIARSRADNDLQAVMSGEKAIGHIVNDVVSVWQAFLDDPSLLRE